MQESEIAGFTSNQIHPISNKHTPNETNISKSNKVHVGIFGSLFLAFLFIVIVLVILFGSKSNLKPQNKRILSPQIWQITIGNKALSDQQISANILVIPKHVLNNRSLLLMREMSGSVELIGFDDNFTNNLNTTTIPDTIIELSSNYSIHKILTATNQKRNEILYAFSYLYESCFAQYDTACGVSVDYNYSLYCHQCDAYERNANIVMKIELQESLAGNDLTSSGVAEEMMHHMLSKYYEYYQHDDHTTNGLSGYFDDTVYSERDWNDYAWSIYEESDDPEEKQSFNRSERRNLQSVVMDASIVPLLPADYQDQLMNAIASLFDDTLWVEACSFLLEGCDYFQAEVDSGSFSEWYLGSYYYGVESLCIDFQSLPYVSSKTVKNTNENTGTIVLGIDFQPYDSDGTAVKATFSAYTRQKLCIGVIFGEWCYRDVRDDADVQFEINPSFTLELFYSISVNPDTSEFAIEFGLVDTTTTLSQCDFDYDLDGDRSSGDTLLLTFVPLLNILPMAYDISVQFLWRIIDNKICPLAQQYAQQYLNTQVEKIFNGNLEYLVDLGDTNIQMSNGLIHLYNNLWLDASFEYSTAFGIADACREILVNCISDDDIMNNAFASHTANDGGSNNAAAIWNTDCNGDNTLVPRAIVALWDNAHGFNDIDNMKCGAYIDMWTCEYQDSSWIDVNDCYTLHGNDGGSRDASARWQTQCADDYLMTAIYDDDDRLEDVDGWKCCAVNTTQYEIDYSACTVIGLGTGNDGGSRANNVRWHTQCEYNQFVVAMYDDDDGFNDVDAIKCCSVNKLRTG